MLHISGELYLLDGFPRNLINIYLMGDVLLDAGTVFAKGRILRQLAGRRVSAHALTHAHPDHQGASHSICTALGIPFWVGEGDVDAAESGDLRATLPPGFLGNLSRGPLIGRGHPVSRPLKEGDSVGGFTVIETPGHSPGHLSYWRPRDRVLITGDVVFNMNPYFLTPGLHLPPDHLTIRPNQNRDSARKLAALEPEIICFGHGPILRDGDRFQRFVADVSD